MAGASGGGENLCHLSLLLPVPSDDPKWDELLEGALLRGHQPSQPAHPAALLNARHLCWATGITQR